MHPVTLLLHTGNVNAWGVHVRFYTCVYRDRYVRVMRTTIAVAVRRTLFGRAMQRTDCGQQGGNAGYVWAR